MSKIFYERFLKGADITLFSMTYLACMKHLVQKSLMHCIRNMKKIQLYQKTIPARTLIGDVLKERAETGRTSYYEC